MSVAAGKIRDQCHGAIVGILKFAKNTEKHCANDIKICIDRLERKFQEFEDAHNEVLKHTGSEARSFQESLHEPTHAAYTEAHNRLMEALENAPLDQQPKQTPLSGTSNTHSENNQPGEPQTKDGQSVQEPLGAASANWANHQDEPRRNRSSPNTEMYAWPEPPKHQQASSIEQNMMMLMQQQINSLQQMLIAQQARDLDQPAHKPLIPRITIPKFSGCVDEWMQFHDLFRSLVGNNTRLSGSEKLHHLKAALTGEAEQLIRPFAITDDNYAEAWAMLLERYNNPRVIVGKLLDNMLDISTIIKEDNAKLRKLIDVSNESIRSLRVLNQPVEHWDAILVHILCKKLDPESRRYWELEIAKAQNGNTFNNFMLCIERKCRAYEISDLTNQPSSASPTPAPRSRRSLQTHLATTTNSERVQYCVICQKTNHEISRCQQYDAMGTEKRHEIIARNGLCFNCLRPNHFERECRSAHRCQYCKRRHHSSLHTAPITALPTSEKLSAPVEPVTAMHFSESTSHTCRTMLATAVATIKHRFRDHKVRILIDSGSESSFVTEDLVQRIKLSKINANVAVTGLTGASAGTTSGLTNFILESTDRTFRMHMQALVLKKITNDLPRILVSSSKWPHIKDLLLADPTFDKPGEIDLLLGADYYHEIIDNGLRRGATGTPIAQQTRLGWILSGIINGTSNVPKIPISSLHAQLELDQAITRFWEIDDISNERVLTEEEAQCEKHFRTTHRRLQSGRYEVKLPFKEHWQDVGFSRRAAASRLTQMERRFRTNKQLQSSYTEFLTEYAELGHMTEVASGRDNVGYYLPHHAVIKPDSSTTKLRVVFDASQTTTSGSSLNDMLMVGPKIQNDLYEILLKFRKHRIALSADITKMYRQILVTPNDRCYQKILWRNSSLKDVREFELNTVTYGTSAAPFLAVRTLQQLALDEEETFPVASSTALADFYVDDLITGCDEESAASDLHETMSAMLGRGGFEIRKWASNSQRVLSAIPTSHQELQPELDLNKETIKALGLHWKPSEDIIFFKCNIPSRAQKTTKRSLLSDLARLFDPIGLVAPVIIVGKIIFQQLWQRDLAWDDEIPEDVNKEWQNYRDGLLSIINIKINRWLFTDSSVNMQLHGFSDASERAYAAAMYMRTVSVDGRINVNIITAKTKVSPTKQISLPRLELCAALLLSKLVEIVRRALSINNVDVFCWSDSTITLAWIHGKSTKWKTFVANRVSKIQSLTEPGNWKHVASNDNPADCASRGMTPAELAKFPLWWHGPSWLCSPEASWDVKHSQHSTDLERKADVISLTTATTVIDFMNDFSSWSRLKRVVANCHRFARNSKIKTPELRQFGPLTTQELHNAGISCIRKAQVEHFTAEISAIDKKGTLPPRSKLMSLLPFKDNDDVLRVGGRLQHTDLEFQKKNQIILPPHHHVTDLILREIHERHLHAGNQLMLARLRSTFWLPNARAAIRHFIYKCVKCFRQRAHTQQQLMGSLPAVRVNPGRAFIKTGVDYAGPILLRLDYRRGPAKKSKAYIAVFVCMVTRAIHLEIVSDMTSEAFIAAFHRFVSRRGPCAELHSDNGTTFKGADKELKIATRQFNAEIASKVVAEGTQWHFIPPAAPHFGGIWEAGVKSVKYHLRRVMGASLLTYEDTQTLLCQIEACLNSRPLCPMSDDPDDHDALTPGHFLIGDALTALPEPDLTKISHLSRFQQLQRQKQQFWNSWRNEYLARLQQRPKWTTPTPNVKIGQLVLIKDNNSPPTHWNLGRISSIHPGADELVRVVTVTQGNGQSSRKLPISKICILPINY